MKSLIIYYSRTGNTHFVAEEIAAELGSKLKQVIDEKNRSGLIGWIGAGFDAMRQKATQIKDIKITWDDFDLFFIGCPNWAGNLPPAIRAALEKADLENKKIVLFCTQENSGAEKVFNSLRRLIKGAEIIDEKYFNRVKNNQEKIKEEIKEWLVKFKTQSSKSKLNS